MPSAEKKKIVDFFKRQSLIAKRSASSPTLSKSLFSVTSGCVKKKKKLSIALDDNQRILDAGQKLIGMIACKQCGMAYSIDVAKEVEEHSKFHNRFTNRSSIKVPINVVEQWRKSLVYERIGDRILFYLRNSSQCLSMGSRITSIVENLVNEEVGFCGELSVWGPSTSSRSAFVCVQQDENGCLLTGLALCDPIYEAQWFSTGEAVKTERCDPIMGINRIWVHTSARGAGIAQSLLTFACSRFLVGRCVPVDQVAFSDPTDAGKKLASKFTGRSDGDFLVYQLKQEQESKQSVN